MPVLAFLPIALFIVIGIAVRALSVFIDRAERRRARLYAEPRVRRTIFRPFIIAGGKPPVVDAPLPTPLAPNAPVDDSLPARAARRHR